YNEAKYLPRLLCSIRRQTFKNYEIIVADNNSSDNTRKIAENCKCRIVKGGSPSEGRNRGADVAHGDVLLFLDADVILESPYFLESSVKEFERKNLGTATCIVKPLSDKKVDKLFHSFYNQYSIITRPVRAHAPGFCIFARRDSHNQINGFDESIKLAEDHDYAIRAARCGKFRILKSAPLHVSVRRLERDGRFNVVWKYALCEMYMWTGARVRSDMFNYTFGYSKKNIVKF
ncbi:MAG: glycosyltransferase, partial [Parcubacteria group bacterium]|nr:glycosyltransferase [Parcubacteria group bacterium]